MISIVVPLYNEQDRFSLESWSYLIREIIDCQWYFVDDGSQDMTSNLLNELKFKNVEILTLINNVGKGEAVRLGMLKAMAANRSRENTLVGYLDCDGSFDFAEVPGIVRMAKSLLSSQKYTFLIASRVKLSGRNVERNPIRHYLGRIIATFVCLGWTNSPYDTQSGFKVLSLKKGQTFILENPFRTRWFFDIELMVRLEKLNHFVPWELTVNYWRDTKGSKLKPTQFFRVLFEIFSIRKIVNSMVKSQINDSN